MSGPIDVHCHFVPSQFPQYSGRNPSARWPSMQHDGCGHASVIIQGKNYRTVVEQAWDGAKRVVDMDRQGIARQVVSPMPELMSYWLEVEDAKVLVRHVNDQIAELCAANPGRFSGLGGVPLQDVDAAVRELEHVLRARKLLGVEIATHVNGVAIGDARFEPFFAEAERLDMVVFVHALHPTGIDRVVGSPRLASPNQTSPTGFSALPPPGPAMPVTATLTLARDRARAPSAIARATSALTAPCRAISTAGTSIRSVFASLE